MCSIKYLPVESTNFVYVDVQCKLLIFTSNCSDYPDAPLDVQVELGPQEKTLLVTWLPVTLTANGTSNGTVVTGYSVIVNGQKVKDITYPTGK